MRWYSSYQRNVASIVIPTGYSFNLDRSTLYLVLASMTIAKPPPSR